MTREELMIGDWVKFPNGIEKIVDLPYIEGRGICASFAASATLFPVPVEALEPIPLTPEILEKNGFTLDYDNHLKIYHGFFGKSHIIIEFSTDRKVGIEIHNEFSQKDSKGRSDLVTFARDWCNEFYIHELQHALKLCGINLEIRL